MKMMVWAVEALEVGVAQSLLHMVPTSVPPLVGWESASTIENLEEIDSSLLACN